MKPEEIAELKEHKRLMEKLTCPRDGGVQFEDRRCFGVCYSQYRCVRCGFVESYESRSDRAWEALGYPMKYVRVVLGRF